MNFEGYKIADIKKAMTNLIKRHKTIASATQEILMGLAFEIESAGSVQELTRFVTELSDTDSEGKLHLSSTARQVGFYMKSHLPLEWDTTTQTFVMAEVEEGADPFDYAKAVKLMEAVRWDKYKKLKADEAFNADVVVAKAIAMLKSVGAHQKSGDIADDDPALLKANAMLKAA